jgi:hypothetical protein
MGDGFVLVMNIEWGHNFTRFCSSMAYCFLIKLYKLTYKKLQFRAGISYGKLSYGYMDKRLRFFGTPINLASRYETKSCTTSFTTDRIFYNKICAEGMFANPTCTIETVPLRGFGDREIFHIAYESNCIDSSDIPDFTDQFDNAAKNLSIQGTQVLHRIQVKKLKTIDNSITTSSYPSSNDVSPRSHSSETNPESISLDVINCDKTIKPYHPHQTSEKWLTMEDFKE